MKRLVFPFWKDQAERRLRRSAIWSIAILVAIAARPAGADEIRRLSYSDAIKGAGKTSLLLTERSVAIAERRLAAAKARRWARVDLESNLFLWNEEISVNFGIPGMEPMPGMPAAEPLVVRGRITSTTTLSVAQPLTGQLALAQLVDVERKGIEVSKLELKNARLIAEGQASDLYFQLLQAQAGRSIAEARVAQLDAQLTRAKALQEGGMLQRVDVMRLEAARAAAQQQAIRARAGTILAGEALGLLLGMSSGVAVEPVDNLPDPPPPPAISSEKAVTTALEGRPDLAVARMRIEQAKADVKASMVALLPSINAVASFQHSEGGGTLSSADAWFVGGTLSWNLWDWGSTWQNYKATRVEAEQAGVAAGLQTDSLKVEVRARIVEAQTAFESLDAARVGLAAAEEAYRITDVRFNEGAATTTDLLDAEAEVTSARLAYATARYTYLAALAQVERAMGRSPDAFLQGSKSTEVN